MTTLLAFSSISLAQMHTLGQFGVSPGGAATYSIPIQVPPGVAGVQPRLSFEFSSQAGADILGNGMGLSGISVITRCPKTLGTDGVVGTVNYDQEDRFCLDGQRLIFKIGTGSGQYGSPSSEYRTEIDGFSRITAVGVASGNGANGPESFIVQTKAGTTMEFGRNSDSRIEVHGKSVVRVWALNKVTDAIGNTIDVSYYEDGVNPWFYPVQMSYGGNSVRFEYEVTPHSVPIYEAGSVLRKALRMKKLATFSASGLVKEYRLSYHQSVDSEPYMSNIQECSSHGLCLTATTFELNLAGAGDTFANEYKNAHSGGPSNNILGDFNGDGRTDLASYTGSNGAWHLCLSIGTEFSCSIWYGHGGGASNNISGDFNGDGKTDIAGYMGNRMWHLCLSTGASFSCGVWTGHEGGVGSNFTGDFNGDGRTDIATYKASAVGVWTLCLSTGSGFSCSDWNGHSGGPANNIYGDFDGDGKTDIAGYTGSNGAWHLCLSTGTAFACSIWYGHGGGATNNIIGDFNGDGKTDIAGYAGPNGQWHLCLSTGIAFSCSTWVGHSGGYANNITGDFNGDGKTDIAGYTGSEGAWHFSYSARQLPTVLKIAPSVGQVIQVDYARLSVKPIVPFGSIGTAGLAPVYTPDSGAVYPRVDLQIPMEVVRSVFTSNGLGTVNQVSYQYGGLKAEQASTSHWGSGRGLLGFRWMKSTEEATGIQSYTEFSQDWPSIGAAKLNETRKSGVGYAGLLKRSTTSYSAYTGSIPSTWFVAPFVMMEESWDLSGAVLPTIQTLYEYLPSAYEGGNTVQYGDPSKITMTTTHSGQFKGRKETINSYHAANTSGSSWILGRLKRAQVTSSQPSN